MPRARHDVNLNPTIIGVLETDGATPQEIAVDSIGRLLVSPRGGLIPVPFSRLTFSNADANGNYQTATIKNGVTTVGALTIAYDGNSKIIDIEFSS